MSKHLVPHEGAACEPCDAQLGICVIDVEKHVKCILAVSLDQLKPAPPPTSYLAWLNLLLTLLLIGQSMWIFRKSLRVAEKRLWKLLKSVLPQMTRVATEISSEDAKNKNGGPTDLEMGLESEIDKDLKPKKTQMELDYANLPNDKNNSNAPSPSSIYPSTSIEKIDNFETKKYDGDKAIGVQIEKKKDEKAEPKEESKEEPKEEEPKEEDEEAKGGAESADNASNSEEKKVQEKDALLDEVSSWL